MKTLENEIQRKRILAMIHSYMSSLGRRASHVKVTAEGVGGEYSFTIERSVRKGWSTAPISQEFKEALLEHRNIFLKDGAPWLVLEVKLTKAVTIKADYESEPAFAYSTEALLLDMIEYPRHLSEVPEWMQNKILRTGK